MQNTGNMQVARMGTDLICMHVLLLQQLQQQNDTTERGQCPEYHRSRVRQALKNSRATFQTTWRTNMGVGRL